jgi:TRAP-type transport system periplasmic protein
VTSTPKNRRYPIAMQLFALLALFSLVAAACGGDDDDTAATGGDATEDSSGDAVEGGGDAEEAEGGGDEAAPEGDAVEYEELELQLASFLSPTTSQGAAITWWIEELAARTNGAVTVEPFWEASLLGPQEIRDGVADGRVALGNVSYAYTPADFSLSSIVEVPLLGGNVGAQAVALNAMYANNADFRAEWENQGVKVLSFVGVPAALTGAEERIESIDWFEGKTVRASGFFVKALEAIGASPAALPVNDVYEAMQRGTVDAYGGLILDVITPFGLHEVGPFIHDAGLGHYASSTFVMSLEQWESLSPELQALIEELNAQYPAQLVAADTAATEAACNLILDEGGEVLIWDEAETQRWADAIGDAPLNEWIGKAEAAGVADGAAMYEEFVGYYREAETTGEFAGAPSPMEACVAIQDARG